MPTQDAGDGIIAAAVVGGGILDSGMSLILQEFKALQTEAAKAAFADSWIRQTSNQLERTWPVFYELLRILRDQELFLKSEYMTDNQSYPTFASYFETIVQKPFQVWVDLENTYNFVHNFSPNLFNKPLSEVREEIKVEIIKEEAKNVTGSKRGNPNDRIKIPKYRMHIRKKNIAAVTIKGQTFTLGQYGTSESLNQYRLILEKHGLKVKELDVQSLENTDSMMINCDNVTIDHHTKFSPKRGSASPKVILNQVAQKVAIGDEVAKNVLEEVKEGKRSNAQQIARDAGIKTAASKQFYCNVTKPTGTARTLCKKFVEESDRAIIAGDLLGSLELATVAELLRSKYTEDERRKLIELL